MNDTLKLSQWEPAGNGTFYPTASTIPKLESGYYEFQYTQRGLMFRKQGLNTDELLNLADSKSTEIMAEISKFWSAETKEKFKKKNYLHRRGFLLHGPPGSGKTSIVQLVIDFVTKNDGLVFSCTNPDMMEEGLRLLRAVEPVRPVVCLFEDIDSLIENYGESELLHLLDGENQIDHVLNVATTNFLKKLPERIRMRPRRFDRSFEIGLPNAKMREAYLKVKHSELTPEEMKIWVKETNKFSFAAMTDLVISVTCMDIPFKEAAATLRTLMKLGAVDAPLQEEVI